MPSVCFPAEAPGLHLLREARPNACHLLLLVCLFKPCKLWGIFQGRLTGSPAWAMLQVNTVGLKLSFCACLGAFCWETWLEQWERVAGAQEILTTSMSRTRMQLWPCVVLVLGVSFR